MSVAYPPDVIVVPLGASEPQPFPSKRTDLGCTMVAEGLPRSLGKVPESTRSLQTTGGPQRSRTPDLRRAQQDRTASHDNDDRRWPPSQRV